MNYQVTCVCGNRFEVGGGQIGRHVACPSCNRALLPLLAEPVAEVGSAAPSGTAGSGPAGTLEPTKRCPFCGEVILAVARKCRHCNEFLDRAPADQTAGSAAGVKGVPGAGAAGAGAGNGKPEAVFVLSVSQWDNFWRYLTCVVIVGASGGALYGLNRLDWFHNLVGTHTAALVFLIVLAMTFLTALLFYLGTRNARCTIWPTRLETETGIFSKKVDSLELYRVTDIELKQNFFERVLGIGTVTVKSTDAMTPVLELYQIPTARKVQKYLLEQLPKVDKQRGVIRVEQ